MDLQGNHIEKIDRTITIEAPLVSIVILNWNGKEHLRSFLPSVLAATYVNKRVIIADNGSTDDSIAFLRQHFPEVEILASPVNEGFAKGYNTALRQVTSDYYVLLNNDVAVSAGWIEPIIELMEADEAIAVCQPKLLDFNNKQQFEYAGACGGWLDSLGYPFARGRVFEQLELDRGQYETAQACFWASGAAMFVRAAAFKTVGGLDEYFFAHQEEIDFCWRIQLAGYKVYVEPSSVVYHLGGGTLSKGNRLKNYLNFRNNLVMLAKNLPFTKAIFILPIRFGLDAVAAWRGIFSGDRLFFISIFHAHLDFFKWMIVGRKKSVFPISKKGKLQGKYAGSVVWQHFIKRKNSFSQIVTNK
jgi:GT2 family glycosyltransferase